MIKNTKIPLYPCRVIRGRQQSKIEKYCFAQGRKKRIGTKYGKPEHNNGRLGNMEQCGKKSGQANRNGIVMKAREDGKNETASY